MGRDDLVHLCGDMLDRLDALEAPPAPREPRRVPARVLPADEDTGDAPVSGHNGSLQPYAMPVGPFPRQRQQWREMIALQREVAALDAAELRARLGDVVR